MTEFNDVRPATPDDEKQLMELLELNYQENPIASVNWDKVLTMVRKGTEKQLGIIGVIDGKKGLEATAGFLMSQFWFTDDWHLEEVWTFVHPNYRRTTHARRLYEYGKFLSESLENMPVLFGVLTTKRMEAKVKLAQRQLQQVGALFLYPNHISDAYVQREFAEPKSDTANAAAPSTVQ